MSRQQQNPSSPSYRLKNRRSAILTHRRIRVDRFAIPVSVLSLVGPSLIGPVRLDHIVLYGITAMLLIQITLDGDTRDQLLPTPRSAVVFYVSWSLILGTSLVGQSIRLLVEPPTLLAFLAGLDSFLLTICAFFIAHMVIKLRGFFPTLRSIGVWLLVLLTLDTALKILFILSGIEILQNSDAQLASFQHIGIFQQPAQAGISYSAAGIFLSAFMLSRKNLFFALLVIVSLGGFLAHSKIFLIGGILLILGLSFYLGKLEGIFRATISLATGLVLSIFLNGPPTLFLRIFSVLSGERNESLLWALTAGRFGESQDMISLAEYTGPLLKNLPFFGLGPSAISDGRVVLDSALAHLLTLSGPIGVATWGLIIVVLLSSSLALSSRASRGFGVATVALVLGAGLGIEPLSSNQAGTVLAFFSSLICFSPRSPFHGPRAQFQAKWAEIKHFLKRGGKLPGDDSRRFKESSEHA